MRTLSVKLDGHKVLKLKSMINWSFLNLKLLVSTQIEFSSFDNCIIVGFPVEADILAQIENLKSGKDAVKVTTSQDSVSEINSRKNQFHSRHHLIPV